MWVTTKDGRHVNTDWFDEDDKNKYRQIEANKKEADERNGKRTNTIVNGKDISATWERRQDQFDFEIEDVINAQGFDGLPRVVPADEFEKHVKDSKIMAFRGYHAPNQEVLDSYKKQLYEGKWYVDCSSGGSIYGRGMYTTYNTGTKIDENIFKAAEKYSWGDVLVEPNTVGTVETMTFEPSMKNIKYEKIKELSEKYNSEHGTSFDEGTIATLYGYDGILVGKLDDKGYLVVLNRTKVIFKGE